jgi:hypothetical protein
MKSKIRVVISGLFFPLTMMEYFIRAFLRRDDVELFTAGPFSNTYIPWNGGMQIDARYVRTPSLCLPYPPISDDPTFIEKNLPWNKVDLWIQFDAGYHLSRRPDAVVSVVVGTDPHVLNYEVPRILADKFFCMQKTYMREGDIYLPYAYDPVLHKNLPDMVKNYDVCLCGLHYEQRNSLLQALQSEGISTYYGIGKVYEEYVEVYNQSRIALNWSSSLDLNARTFEAFGMKIPLVTNRIPDLDLLFHEGEHYLGFDTVSQAVDRVKEALHGSGQANLMASYAYEEVKKKHTYDIRVQQILEECGYGAL